MPDTGLEFSATLLCTLVRPFEHVDGQPGVVDSHSHPGFEYLVKTRFAPRTGLLRAA